MALLGALWGLVAVWAQSERSEVMNSNAQILAQLNSAIAEQTNGLLKLAEVALTTANAYWQANPHQDVQASPAMLALAEELRHTSDGLLDLVIVRADGEIDSIPPRADLRAANAAERDYFAAQTAGSPTGLFLGRPVLGGRSGEWRLTLTMVPGRLQDGSFLIAPLNLQRLAELRDLERMKPNGAVTITRTDGAVLARAPFDERIIRMSFATTPIFNDIWLKNTRTVYLSPAAVTDQKPRLISVIRLKDYDVFVAISAPVGDLLAPWRSRVAEVSIASALISLLAIATAFYLMRSLERSAESRRRFVDIAETASDLVWEVDTAMRFRFISNRYRQVLGLEEEQILGFTPEELGWQALDAEVEARLVSALKARAPITEVPLVQHRPGAPEKIAAISGRAYFRNGKFCGYRGIMTDITERVRQEKERQLRAEREAQTSKLEVLGQLAGGIAHDFNNLLGAILGFGQFLVQDSPPGSPQRRYAERVVMAGERGRGLVQQILAFSRRTPGAPAAVLVGEVVRETVELLKPTIPSTTVLTVEHDGNGVFVIADRSQLGQILVNLCINASDALDGQPGEVRVTIDAADAGRPVLKRLPVGVTKPTPTAPLTWTDEEGFDWVGTGGLTSRDNVSITVTDTGAGIPREHLGQLFDLFFTTKLNGGGTGLGLAVVHRVVTEHGGAILVRTKAGVGTVFEVILPRAAAGIPDRPPADAVSETPRHRAATVLVVDDDEDFCAMMQTALERLGHEVVSAGDPAEALAAITEDPSLWGLVVTDQTMPGMKGTDLVRRIKATAPAVRCIICTGYSSSLNETEALAAGADAFRTKPLDLDDFAAQVDRVLTPERPAPCAGVLIAGAVHGRLDSDGP
ncbi:ATP-binding protein [Azospirillum sp. TSO22-1]|uniref:ATP-binding protein n=1 Tax=Azospirillum sp. TSO22-1 TaxID=716789 RepID=UPI001304932B|nr:ATP-binding protein [Azospirillum sp. TSO22-1]